jgi:hypothetical protein
MAAASRWSFWTSYIVTTVTFAFSASVFLRQLSGGYHSYAGGLFFLSALRMVPLLTACAGFIFVTAVVAFVGWLNLARLHRSGPLLPSFERTFAAAASTFGMASVLLLAMPMIVGVGFQFLDVLCARGPEDPYAYAWFSYQVVELLGPVELLGAVCIWLYLRAMWL